MNKFVRNLLTEWRKLELPFESETIVVAVSGGADSVSLVLALNELRESEKLKLNFIVAHFNHNLRSDESKKDAEFVKALSKKLQLKFVGKIQNSKSKIQDQKGNLEETARQARYDFLTEVAEKQNAYAVLTAHTLNDQAETFLLNLIRGSGAQGLGAMRAKRILKEDSDILLVRPLLTWAKRIDTENFATENNVKFRLDRMNDDLKFSRVKIRKQLLPLLAAEYNPKIIERLAKTAFILQENADTTSNTETEISDSLSVSKIKELAKSELYDFLRKWLRQTRGSLRRLELKHIESIERLINSRKSGQFIELPGGEVVIKRSGRLYFEKVKVEKSRLDN